MKDRTTPDSISPWEPALNKMRERWNLGLEFTMTKVFSDHVDGPLSDLYGIKSSFLKNTDWYSNIAISITYEFGKRCATCHYVD